MVTSLFNVETTHVADTRLTFTITSDDYSVSHEFEIVFDEVVYRAVVDGTLILGMKNGDVINMTEKSFRYTGILNMNIEVMNPIFSGVQMLITALLMQ